MRAIYKRELTSYFHSMIGCVFVAFLIAFKGVYFIAYNVNYGYPYFSYVLSGILFVDLIAIPILTMRSFAEERKNKTDQMLLTAPVGLFQIVMGKYLAMVTVLAIPCTIYLLFPLMIKAQGTYALGVVATESLTGAAEAEESVDDSGQKESRLTVISTESMIDAQVTDSFSTLENLDLFMNTVTANFEDIENVAIENVAIEAKSLEVTYNTMQHAGLLSILIIFILPLLILVIGLMRWWKRRKA